MFDELTLTREELLAFSVSTRDEIITSVMRRTAKTPAMVTQRFAGSPGPGKSATVVLGPQSNVALINKLSIEGAFTRAGVLAHVQENPGVACSAIVQALGGGLERNNRHACMVRVGSMLQQLKTAGLLQRSKVKAPTGMGDRLEWYPVS